MINILPPEIKQQLAYAKRNTVLLRYLFIGILLFGLLGLLLGGTLWYVNRQATTLASELQARQTSRQTYQEVEDKVKTLQSNLGLIEKLFNEKTEYSQLLTDIASALPAGSYINNMALIGDDKKPLEILLTVDSFNRAAEVRNALIASARFKSADIQSITENKEAKNFSVVIILAFESGQAR